MSSVSTDRSVRALLRLGIEQLRAHDIASYTLAAELLLLQFFILLRDRPRGQVVSQAPGAAVALPDCGYAEVSLVGERPHAHQPIAEISEHRLGESSDTRRPSRLGDQPRLLGKGCRPVVHAAKLWSLRNRPQTELSAPR